MNKYYGDLHIHIGYNEEGLPVKITGSKDLNIPNISQESANRKGIQIVGIVDCASPRVIKDIRRGIKEGKYKEVLGGGLIYNDSLLIILGSEIELSCKNGSYHIISYLPNIDRMEEFSNFLSKYIKNINLSSQKAKIGIENLFDITKKMGGILVPAHIFTPFKGIYGSCTNSIRMLFGNEIFSEIHAVELGLSGDTKMGSMISELDNKSFLSNSDAHSISKIGREYNLFRLKTLNFDSIVKSFTDNKGNSILENYGLNPKLGKYHRSYCLDCEESLEGTPPQRKCKVSEKHEVIMGVLDRVYEIKNGNFKHTYHPNYKYQVPLEFLPGIGKKTLNKLLDYFGTEMNILNNVSYEELTQVVGNKIADVILKSREGNIDIKTGGGGRYGKIKR